MTLTLKAGLRFLTIVIIGCICAQQVFLVFKIGVRLSPIADSFSEANTLNSAVEYCQQGFLDNAGLPLLDFLPENKLRIEAPEQVISPKKVYTHYPPGPNWLVGVLAVILGPREIPKFRLLPILVAGLSMLWLARSLIRVSGETRCCLAFLLYCCIPMFTNMMHGLHQQSYNLSLILAQWAVLLMSFQAEREVLFPYAAVAIIGFLQGWMGFDYFFLVALSAIPFWLKSRRWASKRARQKAFCFTVMAACGFAFAHFLHLMQVAAYYNSWDVALNDLLGSARFRSGQSHSFALGFGEGLTATGNILSRYWFDLVPSDTYFGAWFWIVLSVSALLFLTRHGSICISNFEFSWHFPLRFAVSIICAGIISSLWIVVMQNHGWNHPHFLPRHFFMVLFIAVTLCLDACHVGIVQK